MSIDTAIMFNDCYDISFWTCIPISALCHKEKCAMNTLSLKSYLEDDINSQLRLFADDALLYRPINTPQDHIILQQDLTTLENWARAWDMQFNTKKCYIDT